MPRAHIIMIPIEMGSNSKNGDTSGFDGLGLIDALAAINAVPGVLTNPSDSYPRTSNLA